MKLKTYLGLLFFCILSVDVVAQTNLNPSTARPASMADAYVSQTNIDALTHNQAGIASIETSTLAFSYQSRFSLKQLSTSSILAVIPSSVGNWGFDFHRIGWKNWDETNVSASYAKRFGERTSAGIAFNLYASKIPEENSNQTATSVDMGVIYRFNDKTSFAIHLSDPFVAYNFDESEGTSILRAIRLGGHTQFTPTFLLSYELIQVENQNIGGRMGIEWAATSEFKIRTGISTSTYRFACGVGYQLGMIETDLTVSYHQYLGATPILSIKIAMP